MKQGTSEKPWLQTAAFVCLPNSWLRLAFKNGSVCVHLFSSHFWAWLLGTARHNIRGGPILSSWNSLRILVILPTEFKEPKAAPPSPLLSSQYHLDTADMMSRMVDFLEPDCLTKWGPPQAIRSGNFKTGTAIQQSWKQSSLPKPSVSPLGSRLEYRSQKVITLYLWARTGCKPPAFPAQVSLAGAR